MFMRKAKHLEEMMDERDKRYEREDELRAEALKIKQEADAEALKLAREDVRYKDAQNNKLREQLGEERAEAREREGKFISKEDYERRHDDLTKLVTSIATVQAEGGGRSDGLDKIIVYGIATAGVIVAVAVGILSIIH